MTRRPHTQPNTLMLEGKRALITAAASGMGRETALLFAAHGAEVIVVDINGEQAEKVVGEITDAGGSASFQVVDVTDASAITQLAERVKADNPSLDILYNHAGSAGPPAFEFSQDELSFCLALNLTSSILLTQAMLPLLKFPDTASILFTSSVAGLVASPNSPVYSAVKGGVIQFAKATAVALGPEGIRANTICPGLTDTPMLPVFFGGDDMESPSAVAKIEAFRAAVALGRVGTPGEVADLALFLASDASSYITGTAIPIDGGFVAR